MAVASADLKGKYSFGDLLRHCIATPGPAGHITRQTNVLTGQFSNARYRSGIHIHTADMVEEENLDVEFSAEPRLTLCVLFAGEVAFTVDGQHTHLTATPATGPQTFALTCNGHQRVCRHLRKGRRVCKLVISVNKRWLETEAHHSPLMKRVLEGYFLSENRCVTWPASAGLANLAHQIMHPAPATPTLRVLQQEYQAIQLLNDCLQGFLQQQRHAPPSRLERAMAYIDANLNTPLALTDVANHAGISVSTLQRNFKAATGHTVVQYIRTQKLTRAQTLLRTGKLSIGETAFNAGYHHVSNFVTAYRNAFGITPGDERAHAQRETNAD